jgi:hypothetical protein
MHLFLIAIVVFAILFAFGVIIYNIALDSETQFIGVIFMSISTLFLTCFFVLGIGVTLSTEINPLPIESVSRTKGFTIISYMDSENQIKICVCNLASTYVASDDTIRLANHVGRNLYGVKISSHIKVTVDTE